MHLAVPVVLALLITSCVAPPGAGPDRSSGAGLGPWETIGESVEGRPVEAMWIGAARTSARRIAVIAGIHGDEPEGQRHVEDLAAWLAALPARVRLYRDINPDGSARGTRRNSRGVDPNRNWPAKNFTASKDRGPRPLSEAEVEAAHADLVRFDPELVVVLHSSSRGPFVNYDGPAAAYAERFAAAATRAAPEAWRVEPDMGYATPGSFGSWMGVDRQVPTLTIEFRRGSLPSESGPALRAGVASLVGGGADAEGAGAAESGEFRVR